MARVVENHSDFAKLQMAFDDLTTKFGSVDNLLEAFGLAGMPTAQRYGIMFGCLVFIFTVGSVLSLLILGGSFKRMAEEAETGTSTIQEGYRFRTGRALLLERLLDARQRLLDMNYADREKPRERKTNLTVMLLNVPPHVKASELPKTGLVEEKDHKKNNWFGLAIKENEDGEPVEVTPGYQENYITAYRKCQDKPGGKLEFDNIPLHWILPVYQASHISLLCVERCCFAW
jgi:hypothetical protein